MGYPAILSLEAADTTAGLRPGPDTTDLLLSIKSSARRIKFVRLCSSASGRFHRHERLPEGVHKNNQPRRAELSLHSEQDSGLRACQWYQWPSSPRR